MRNPPDLVEWAGPWRFNRDLRAWQRPRANGPMRIVTLTGSVFRLYEVIHAKDEAA